MAFSGSTTSVLDLITPILEFYTLVSTFPYFPPTDILTPPPAGWQSPHPTNFRRLPKSQKAIDVLTHLSYISTSGNRDWRLGYQDTMPLSYVEEERVWNDTQGGNSKANKADQGLISQYLLWECDLEPYNQVLGRDVVALTRGSQYGAWLLLDVEAGTIREYSALGGMSSSIHQKVPASDAEAGLTWTYFSSTPVKQFFQNWSDKFRTLEWMPVQDKSGGMSGEIFSQEQMGAKGLEPTEIRRIYIDHGWGSDGFRKEECRAALSVWRHAYGKRILREADEGRSPSPPDWLDEISD